MLDGQVVVITGGAGLLGQQFCESVVRNGGKVVIADIELDAANKLALKLGSKNSSRNALPILMDISCPSSVESALSGALKEFGQVNAVVNNAYPRNSNYGRHFFDVTYDDFCQNVSLNLGGYFLVSQIFAKYFKNVGGGNIINLGSIYGVVAPKFEIYNGTGMTTPVEYAAIKSGVIHLTKYMASYLKQDGIRVNSLSPGGIEDGQPEGFLNQYNARCGQKGMLEPKDVSEALLFLLSDSSKFINGQNLIVDDGFCL